MHRFCKRHEVDDRGPLPPVQTIFDVQFQRRPRPALLHGLRGIPFAVSGAIQPGQQSHNMEPRQLVSSLLTKLTIRAMLGKKSHVLQVTGRPATHIRVNRLLQPIMRLLVNLVALGKAFYLDGDV